MESSSLQNGNGRVRRYKEEERVVPTSSSRPPSAQRRVARALKCPRSFSPRENRRKRANLPYQQDCRLTEASHRQELAAKQWWKFAQTARRCPSTVRRWLTAAPGWRLAGGLLRLALALCRQVLPVDIFLLLLAIPSQSLVWIFWNKASHLQKGHKNGD